MVSLFLPVKMWQGPSKAMFLIGIDLNSLFQPLLQHDHVDGVDNTHHLFEHYPVVDEGLRDVHWVSEMDIVISSAVHLRINQISKIL